MDQSTFYDPRSLFDQHHNMRLDIDNRNYEELLAISRCLMEARHCCDQRLDEYEEGQCIICLESYKHRERHGRLKCGHNFHACCIKQWLLIKNVCPICKALALENS